MYCSDVISFVAFPAQAGSQAQASCVFHRTNIFRESCEGYLFWICISNGGVHAVSSTVSKNTPHDCQSGFMRFVAA